MTFVSLKLQLQRYEYFKQFNFVVFVSIVTFVDIYAINMDDVNLFINSLFLVLETLNYII